LIHPVQAALGAAEGTAVVRLRDDSELNSLVADPAKPVDASQATETVAVKRLDDFAADRGITHIGLLKSDTEGYDLEVLRGAERLLRGGAVDFVYVEVAFEGPNGKHTFFTDVHDHLAVRGFRFSGFYETWGWGPRQIWFGFCNALFANAKRIG
jgi:hypothetical protein